MSRAPAPRAIVLVVEDDAPIRALTESVLALSRFEVLSASSAHQALDVLGAAVPDVVVIDLELPGDEDAVLVETLRASLDHEGLRVVGVAGAEQAVSDRRLDVVLRKPRALAALPRALEALIERRDRQAESEDAIERPALAVGDQLFVRDGGEAIGIVRAIGARDFIASVEGEDVILPHRAIAAVHHDKALLDLGAVADEPVRAMLARRA